MLSTLQRFVAMLNTKNIIKPFCLTFVEFNTLNQVQKQNILMRVCKEASFNPKLNTYQVYDAVGDAPDSAEIELYNGVTIHCGIKSSNQALFIDFSGPKHILDRYKKTFDSIKLDLVNSEGLILETRFIDYRFMAQQLELSYYVVPATNIYPILLQAIQSIHL
jgi:hypothetical protein